MIREHLFHSTPGADPHFRWRGGDVSRIENLSDAVFALTLTLIVVASSVPATFGEFWVVVRDLPAFAACFLLLLLIWVEHHKYFRRYGLQDAPTIALNGWLLFLVVFYAYPLKFLMTMLWHLVLGHDMRPKFALDDPTVWPFDPNAQPAFLMIFYGLGVVGVFTTLAFMHWRAYRLRVRLELDELECFLVRSSIRENLFMASVGAASAAMAWLGVHIAICGFAYIALWPLMMGNGIYEGVRAERIAKAMAADGE